MTLSTDSSTPVDSLQVAINAMRESARLRDGPASPYVWQDAVAAAHRELFTTLQQLGVNVYAPDF